MNFVKLILKKVRDSWAMEREIKIFLVLKVGFYYGKVVYIRKCLPFSNTRRGIGIGWDSQKIHRITKKIHRFTLTHINKGAPHTI